MFISIMFVRARNMTCKVTNKYRDTQIFSTYKHFRYYNLASFLTQCNNYPRFRYKMSFQNITMKCTK